MNTIDEPVGLLAGSLSEGNKIARALFANPEFRQAVTAAWGVYKSKHHPDNDSGFLTKAVQLSAGALEQMPDDWDVWALWRACEELHDLFIVTERWESD